MSLTRSEQMSRIRGKNTGPELRLRQALWAEGFRYRLHKLTLAGRPDITFVGKRVAVFIDGCFWHGCPKHYVRPRTRQTFWRKKLHANVERDRRQTLLLEGADWRVIRVWEHEVHEELDRVVSRIQEGLKEFRWKPQPDWRVVQVDVVDTAADVERREVELLRSPGTRQVVLGPRCTAKWTRPRRSPTRKARS